MEVAGQRATSNYYCRLRLPLWAACRSLGLVLEFWANKRENLRRAIKFYNKKVRSSGLSSTLGKGVGSIKNLVESKFGNLLRSAQPLGES